MGGENDPVAYVHYFSQLNGWDWHLVAYDAKTDEAYGLVCGAETEWGFFSIREIEELNRSRGLSVIERDEHFAPRLASSIEGRG